MPEKALGSGPGAFLLENISGGTRQYVGGITEIRKMRKGDANGFAELFRNDDRMVAADTLALADFRVALIS